MQAGNKRRKQTGGRRLETGQPCPLIRDYAEKHDIGLIIMSLRGQNRLEHLIIDSTTECIIQTAPCPVLSVGRMHVSGKNRKAFKNQHLETQQK